jgi:hypothetical protein
MNESGFEWDDTVVVERNDVLDCNEQNLLPHEKDTIAKIRAWLEPANFRGESSAFRKRFFFFFSHLPETGQWFMYSKTLKLWHGDADNGMLWVRGDYTCRLCQHHLTDCGHSWLWQVRICSEFNS